MRPMPYRMIWQAGEAMANCKGCHTRIPAKALHCPHCGQAAPQRGFRSVSSAPAPAPASAPLSTSTASAASPEKPGSSKAIPRNAEIELPLEEEVAVAQSSHSEGGASGSTEHGAAFTKVPRRSAPERKESAGSIPASAAPTSVPEVGFLTWSRDQIRHWVGEHPECLESGLTLEDPGDLSQRGPSDMEEAGAFDWIARSGSGEWVAVFVRSGDPGPSLVSEALQAVGWMRKHLCRGKEDARAIVLLDGIPEDLGYAASAVGEIVSFRTWRVAVTFETLNT